MHQLDKAGLAGAVPRLAVVGAFALISQQDVQAGPKGQGLEGRQVAADPANHGTSLRTKPRSKSSALIV